MASLVSNETTPTLIEDPDVPQNATATIAKTTTTTTATSKTTVNVEGKEINSKLIASFNLILNEAKGDYGYEAAANSFQLSCEEWNVWCDDEKHWNLEGKLILPYSRHYQAPFYRGSPSDYEPRQRCCSDYEACLCDWRLLQQACDRRGEIDEMRKCAMKELFGDRNDRLFWVTFENVTRADITFYMEHEEELPSGKIWHQIWHEKNCFQNLGLNAMKKKIIKRKEEECGIRMDGSKNFRSFVMKVKIHIKKFNKEELSRDELAAQFFDVKGEIDIMGEPSPPLPPRKIQWLDDDELELEDIRRDREAIAENYYKAHPEEVRVTLRPVSPVRKGEGDY